MDDENVGHPWLLKDLKLLSTYVHALACSENGSLGHRTPCQLHGVYTSTARGYFSHCILAMSFALRRHPDPRIDWPPAKEKRSMENTVVGLSKQIEFVNHTKGRIR